MSARHRRFLHCRFQILLLKQMSGHHRHHHNAPCLSHCGDPVGLDRWQHFPCDDFGCHPRRVACHAGGRDRVGSIHWVGRAARLNRMVPDESLAEDLDRVYQRKLLLLVDPYRHHLSVSQSGSPVRWHPQTLRYFHWYFAFAGVAAVDLALEWLLSVKLVFVFLRQHLFAGRLVFA